MITYDSLFIGGAWVRPDSNARIEVLSASTGEPIGSVPDGTTADIDAAVAAARQAFDDPHGWSSWSAARRADAIDSLANEVERRAEEMARRVSSQNGMPIAVATALEAKFPVLILRYMAGLARSYPFETKQPHLLGGTTTVRHESRGVVAAIAPWNFPQVLATVKHAPALAAGCTVVLKPSPEAVLDAFLFAEAVEASDIPPGVINIVPGGREAGAHLVAHPDVDKVAFTGSTAAGRAIAEVCADLLRPVTLELGGKSAAIILDDADLDLATLGDRLFESLILSNGQTCFLSTRILVPDSRYDEIVATLATFVRSLKVGDALDPTTQVGPMATQVHRDRVERYISKGVAEGARLVVGGGRPAALPQGWFVEPTLFVDVDNASTIAREEIFGPVLVVIRYKDDEDAIRLANDSAYGLGGTVWSTNAERAMAVARRVKTGTIGINRYLPDPSAPFGGFKASGLGRELGPGALDAYLQSKSIYS